MKNDKFVMDVGLALDLKLGFVRAHWTLEEIKKLTSGDTLRFVRDFLRGRATLEYVKHSIDCDSRPFVPSGWSVVEHRLGGNLDWNAARLELYQSNGQFEGNHIRCDAFSEEIKKSEKTFLNANVLDYLLKNPELIPDEWEGKCIFFWGTIYGTEESRRYDSHGYDVIRYLKKKPSSRWVSEDGWSLNGSLDINCFAAVLGNV